MTKKCKVLLAISLCFILLLNLSIEVFAVPLNLQNEKNSFSITFMYNGVKTDLDLSEIEVDVYKAILVSADEESDFYQYDEIFEYTAKSNAQGIVNIMKPSEVFSISIDLGTLPDGVGVNKNYEFILESATKKAYVLSDIESIVSTAESLDSIDSFMVLNNLGEEIYANFESDMLFSRNGINNFISDDIVNFNFSVSNGKNIYKTNAKIDLSELSKIDKIDYLYDNTYITEIEKINLYCDALINNEIEGVSCLTPIVSTIEDYVLNSSITAELQYKIDLALANPHNAENTRTEPSNTTEKYSSDNFKIHYDPSVCSAEEAISIANYMETIRTKYINYGFREPPLKLLSTRYNIYITSDIKTHSDGSNVRGTCYKDGTNGNKAYSYFVIYGFNVFNDTIKYALSHEYFHAIQYAYNYTSSWFSEAAAQWGALKTTNIDDSVSNWLNNYLKYDSEEDIFSLRGYELFFVLLCIDKAYGGYNTVEDIYNTLDGYAINYSNEDLLNATTTTIIAKGYSLDSIETIFEKCAIYNAYPRENYQSVCTVDENQADWNNPRNNEMEASATHYTGSTVTLGRFGCSYYFFESESTPNINSTLTISVDTNSNYIECKYIRKSEDGIYDNSATPTSSKYTLVQRNFGTHICKELVVIPINTKTAGSYTYKVTASRYFTPRDGTKYSIKNSSSLKYLSLYNNSYTNGANVIQNMHAMDFELEAYLGNSTSYYIRPVGNTTSTDLVVGIRYGQSGIQSGLNVVLQAYGGVNTQLWNFVEVSPGVYKIVSAADSTLALTSYGSEDGSTGLTSTSPGNVFVSTYTGSDSQLWSLGIISYAG